MGSGWPLTTEVSRVNSARIFPMLLSLCFLVILPVGLREGQGPSLGQFEVCYKFVVSTQP